MQKQDQEHEKFRDLIVSLLYQVWLEYIAYTISKQL